MKKYSKEFKAMAIALIKESNLGTKQTAEKLEIPLKTLEKWITKYNEDPLVFTSKYKTEKQKILELQSEVKSLKKENEILKKTIKLIAKDMA